MAENKFGMAKKPYTGLSALHKKLAKLDFEGSSSKSGGSFRVLHNEMANLKIGDPVSTAHDCIPDAEGTVKVAEVTTPAGFTGLRNAHVPHTARIRRHLEAQRSRKAKTEKRQTKAELREMQAERKAEKKAAREAKKRAKRKQESNVKRTPRQEWRRHLQEQHDQSILKSSLASPVLVHLVGSYFKDYDATTLVERILTEIEKRIATYPNMSLRGRTMDMFRIDYSPVSEEVSGIKSRIKKLVFPEIDYAGIETLLSPLIATNPNAFGFSY